MRSFSSNVSSTSTRKTTGNRPLMPFYLQRYSLVVIISHGPAGAGWNRNDNSAVKNRTSGIVITSGTSETVSQLVSPLRGSSFFLLDTELAPRAHCKAAAARLGQRIFDYLAPPQTRSAGCDTVSSGPRGICFFATHRKADPSVAQSPNLRKSGAGWGPRKCGDLVMTTHGMSLHCASLDRSMSENCSSNYVRVTNFLELEEVEPKEELSRAAVAAFFAESTDAAPPTSPIRRTTAEKSSSPPRANSSELTRNAASVAGMTSFSCAAVSRIS